MTKIDFSQIKFNPQHHTYTLGDQRLRNVTSFVSGFKPPFDADYWAGRKADEREITVDEIKAEWRAKGDASRERGQRVHEHIEAVLQGRVQTDDPFLAMNEALPEERAFDHLWQNKFSSMVEVHKTEWVIGDADLGIAGTADAVLRARDTQLWHLWDWKTGKKFNASSPYGKFLLPPFDDLDECELNVYSLQLSVYRLIIERNTGLELGPSYIVYLSKSGGWKIYEAVDLRGRVEEALRDG